MNRLGQAITPHYPAQIILLPSLWRYVLPGNKSRCTWGTYNVWYPSNMLGVLYCMQLCLTMILKNSFWGGKKGCLVVHALASVASTIQNPVGGLLKGSSQDKIQQNQPFEKAMFPLPQTNNRKMKSFPYYFKSLLNFHPFHLASLRPFRLSVDKKQ